MSEQPTSPLPDWVSEELARRAQTNAAHAVAIAPWPEGVIARYLTVAGATVDISHDMFYLNDTEPTVTVASCGGEGCDASLTEKWGQHAYRGNNGSSGADAEAGKWAQAHAEKCRALPRPAVTA